MIQPNVKYTFLPAFLLAISAQCFGYEVGSRISATGGVSQIEGAAGGGLVPWAVIAGYGQESEWGVNAFSTYLALDNYDFSAAGISFGFSDRVEFNYATQQLDISELALEFGLPDDKLRMETVGVKVRLFNNLIYDAWPQISAGAQFKRNLDFDIPALVGAQDDKGTDLYLAASKLWLDGISGYPILWNVTARYSDANQIGLLGFGGDLNDQPEWLLETSASVLLPHDFVAGFEYRQKPDNLGFATEDDWADVFVAWFPSKHLSLTFAYADLGDIATKVDQRGFYISLQGTL